jgi:hypothetical protein
MTMQTLPTWQIIFAPAPVIQEYWSITEIAAAYGYHRTHVYSLKRKYSDFPKATGIPPRYEIKAVRRFMDRLGRKSLDAKELHPSQGIG